jgi:hypothetical protein
MNKKGNLNKKAHQFNDGLFYLKFVLFLKEFTNSLTQSNSWIAIVSI